MGDCPSKIFFQSLQKTVILINPTLYFLLTFKAKIEYPAPVPNKTFYLNLHPHDSIVRKNDTETGVLEHAKNHPLKPIRQPATIHSGPNYVPCTHSGRNAGGRY